MASVEKSILNALEVNMAYKPEEKVAIILQRWDDSFDSEKEERFKESVKLCGLMYNIYREADVDVELLGYTPEKAANGVDASQELYEQVKEKGPFDIVFMPTAYSLTHTKFRKALTDSGARVASMPGFTTEMFGKDGPMDIDYEKVARITKEVGEKLENNNYVRITGEGTDITVEVNNDLVLTSDGMITNKGEYGNLPGAEAFAVPRYEGDSNGYITVKKGWGGSKPVKHPAKLIIENGRFTKVECEDEQTRKEIQEVIFGGKDYDVLAEIGIGTNPNVTPKYIEKHGWSTLTAEKIYGSAHFANGNSAAMGGENDVPIHVDWVVPNVKIEFLKTL